jgi:hypothetical protein
MTLLQLNELIFNARANAGPMHIHLIMNYNTLDDLLKQVEPYLYTHAPITFKDESSGVIFNTPVFINGQVPDGEAYPMYGSKPVDCKV